MSNGNGLRSKLEEYELAKQEVSVARARLRKEEEERASLNNQIAAADQAVACGKAYLQTALKRYGDVASQLPALLHAEVAGVVGRDKALLEQPKAAEAAE